MKHELTIRQLEMIAIAAECRTFSEAATRLEVSQSAMSNTVRQVEEQVGFKIFDRTTRSMRLTPEGRRLADVAKDLISNFTVALNGITENARGTGGRMTIAALPSVTMSLLAPALALFRERFPDFVFSIRDSSLDQTVQLVLDGVASFAVTAGAISSPQLISEPMMRDNFYIACQPSSPLAALTSVTWDALKVHPLIISGRNPSRYNIEDDGMAVAAMQPRYETEQINSAIALVKEGMGVAVLPGLSQSIVESQGLVVRPLIHPAVSRPIQIVYRADRPLSEPMLFAIECFKRAAARSGRK